MNKNKRLKAKIQYQQFQKTVEQENEIKRSCPQPDFIEDIQTQSQKTSVSALMASKY